MDTVLILGANLVTDCNGFANVLILCKMDISC